MAYNILKGDVQFVNSTSGTIESMVDDHSNQTIAGIKTFSQMVTASLGISSSAYYGNGSGLSGLDVAVTTFSNPTSNALIVAKADANISGAVGLDYNGTILNVTGNISASLNISSSGFYGPATGLTIIPATQLNGNVSAANIAFDANTLANNSGNLQVNLSSASGLESTATGIRINASLATVKPSPVNNDKFIIADSAAGNAPKHMLYSAIASAITSGITTYPPNGNNGEIQFKNGSAFQGDAGLVYASATDTLTTVNLTASGHISSSNYFGDGSKLSGLSTTSYGFFTFNFGVVAENDFIGVVTTGSAITASLPAAASFNPGKRFTFKDVSGSCSGSNHIVISASLNSSGESIDGEGIVKIKSAYGSVTIVSDGLSQYYIESVN
jgi:hypothetical protein